MTPVVEQSHRIHEFLLSPLAYPERPKDVELKETHISWVYLTDRYVYKQKKAVAFEFLDFSTLEKRRHFCEQEVALNQRLSPDVYLGVVPVTIDGNGEYRLASSSKSQGKVVEWLVKMTKLDERKTLENLIRNERLTDSQISRLSKRLTEFYSSQAPAMLRSDEFLRRLTQHVVANRNDMMMALPHAEQAIQFVGNAQLRCLTLESDYFVQRVADGRVVDGHGDLRPEHVYFRRDRPAIIDCIEFHSEYRTNDVVDELAFLSMECDRLGNHEVGESIISSYLLASTDSPKPFLSTFYHCYRACVRAKIAALRAKQAGGETALDADASSVKSEVIELAEKYLDMARGYAERIGPLMVIMVGGLSGTGKSTLATALRDCLSAEILQTDVIRRELFQPNSPNGKYTSEGRLRVYKVMADRIQDSLLRSPTVILDGTFSTQAARQSVYERVNSIGAKLLQVQCECPTDVAMSRISSRLALGKDPSEATPDVHQLQSQLYEATLPNVPQIAVETTNSVDEQALEVLAIVSGEWSK